MTSLIRLKQTAEQVGWHPVHVMKVVRDPEYGHLNFPKPVRLGKNSIAFVSTEIDAWIEARIADRDAGGFKTCTAFGKR